MESKFSDVFPDEPQEDNSGNLNITDLEKRLQELGLVATNTYEELLLEHDEAWRAIAAHLGGLCLSGVDVKGNQQQICAAIDAAWNAAYREGRQEGYAAAIKDAAEVARDDDDVIVVRTGAEGEDITVCYLCSRKISSAIERLLE